MARSQRRAARLFRAIVLGGASLVGGTALAVICDASCSGETAGPTCSPYVHLQSPCGFRSITTTCTGAPARCDESIDAGASAWCQIGSFDDPVTKDCTVSVVLGDGTRHDMNVNVAPSGVPDCSTAFYTPASFYSTTCRPPEPSADAGSDASGDAGATDAGEAGDAHGEMDASGD